MDQKEILQLAHKAGFNPVDYMGSKLKHFERFASLLTSSECESCAQLVEGLLHIDRIGVAAAIRERKTEK